LPNHEGGHWDVYDDEDDVGVDVDVDVVVDVDRAWK
jgi:hypothetical protein